MRAVASAAIAILGSVLGVLAAPAPVDEMLSIAAYSASLPVAAATK